MRLVKFKKIFPFSVEELKSLSIIRSHHDTQMIDRDDNIMYIK